VPCHCATNAWLQSASQKKYISHSTSWFYSLLFSFFFLSRFRFFIFCFLPMMTGTLFRGKKWSELVFRCSKTYQKSRERPFAEPSFTRRRG
jgi:hypothetical protein